MIKVIYFKCRTKWTTNSSNSSKEGKQSATKKLKGAKNSRKRNHLLLPIEKIHLKKNLFFNMSYSSRNSIMNILIKKDNSFSIPKINVMSTSLYAPLSDPLNLDFYSCTIMKSAHKDSADSFNMRNLILLMSSQNAYQVLPTLEDGKKATVSIWVFYFVLYLLELDMMLTVYSELLLSKLQQKMKHWWTVISFQTSDNQMKIKISKNNLT